MTQRGSDNPRMIVRREVLRFAVPGVVGMVLLARSASLAISGGRCSPAVGQRRPHHDGMVGANRGRAEDRCRAANR